MIKKQKGFTLIELLVVIAIIGLLSTLAVVSFGNARTKARDAKRKSDVKQMCTAMELYYSENNSYPGFGACGATANGVISGGTGGLDTAGSIDTVCPAGNRIGDANATYLASLPAAPNAAETYSFDTQGTNYCIGGALEIPSGDYFVCLNGSTFQRNANCAETGL